jgi:predicted dehydrogenase
MIDKVKWGILGTANIAVKKVIPAMQRGDWSQITAIASRDLTKAQEAARQLEIPKAYGSYEELLADSEIEAIYNPPAQPSPRSMVHYGSRGRKACPL